MLRHISIHLRTALGRITREQAAYERIQAQPIKRWLKDYENKEKEQERRREG